MPEDILEIPNIAKEIATKAKRNLQNIPDDELRKSVENIANSLINNSDQFEKMVKSERRVELTGKILEKEKEILSDAGKLDKLLPQLKRK